MASAIEVRNVSKHFKLYHEQYHTLKERLIFLRRAKRFEEFHALEDVSFEVEEGTTFGLIGANGSGKSTILKLMAGILRPSDVSLWTLPTAVGDLVGRPRPHRRA